MAVSKAKHSHSLMVVMMVMMMTAVVVTLMLTLKHYEALIEHTQTHLLHTHSLTPCVPLPSLPLLH